MIKLLAADRAQIWMIRASLRGRIARRPFGGLVCGQDVRGSAAEFAKLALEPGVIDR
jgi:hypothetical protein